MTEKPKKPGKTEQIIFSKGALASRLKLSVRQVNRLIARGLPCEPGGGFILEKVRSWRQQNLRPRSETADNPELVYWKNELLKEQSLLLSLKRRKANGELTSLENACRESEKKVNIAKVLLEQIPDRVLGHLPKSLSAKQRKEFLKNMQELIEDTLFTLAETELKAIDAA
jgi:phage terminase Nu1 subunit (DNA packaging protein)